jgi:uncharacterized protein (UPF0261 family)
VSRVPVPKRDIYIYHPNVSPAERRAAARAEGWGWRLAGVAAIMAGGGAALGMLIWIAPADTRPIIYALCAIGVIAIAMIVYFGYYTPLSVRLMLIRNNEMLRLPMGSETATLCYEHIVSTANDPASQDDVQPALKLALYGYIANMLKAEYDLNQFAREGMGDGDFEYECAANALAVARADVCTALDKYAGH